MEAPSSGISSAAVSKRKRLVRFPSGFEKQLLHSCARRSDFMTSQLEFAGEDGSIEMPEEECALWLDALLLT
jgi:hypothetical protein